MKLDKRNVDNIVGLTPTQEGILFHYLLDNNNYQYFEQTCICLAGQLDPDLCRRAWEHVTGQNEALRTTFAWKKIKKPVQLVWKKWELRFQCIDLSALSAEDQEAQFRAIRANDRKAGFDLEDHAFRITLVRQGAGRCALLLSSHSILFDGWSFNVILKEFFGAYTRLAANERLAPREKAQFKDYVKWLQSARPDDGQQYWQRYLAGYEPREMPLKAKFKRDARPETAVHVLKLEEPLGNGIEALSRTHGVSISAFFYTVWGLLLQKLTGENDVVFGTTFAGRSVPVQGVEDIVGNFLNSLPVRFTAGPDQTVLALVRNVFADVQDKQAYEHTSLSKIKEHSGIKGDLFDSLVLFENHPAGGAPGAAGEGLRIDSFTFEHASHYELTVFILKNDPAYEIHFSYNTARFKPQAAAQFATYFQTLLTNALRDVEAPAGTLSLLPESEYRQLVYGFNDTQAPYNRNVNLKDLLEQNLAAFAGRIAVQCNDDQVTYADLHARANTLAWNLKAELGDGKQYVGLILDRSVEMIVGVLAVIKAGYAYVPIDPTLPVGRMKKMVEGLAIRCILTTRLFEEKAAALQGECPSVRSVYGLAAADKVLRTGSAGWEPIDQSNAGNLPSTDRPEDIAYVIFTSGSTGTPKGVMVQHRPVVNIVEWVNRTLAITERDTVLCVASLGFDLSVYDIFGALSLGAVLSVATYEDLASPERLLGKLCRENVTVWNSAPAVLQNIIQWNDLQKVPGLSDKLRVVMLSGDWIGLTLPQKVKNYFRQARVVSLGGATEATIWSNYYFVGDIDPEWNSIPYGKPIQNCTYYILDKNLAPCPVGIVGDLFIGGECLALGYVNDIALTGTKFVGNPFMPGTTMYATGDLARWHADGNMELIGRKDNQIKIRGYRIELGEIESHLRAFPGVDDALAVVHTGETGEKYIWAYYLSETTLGGPEMKKKLAEMLPAYMLPQHIIGLREFPVTANGKVDRKQLPQPEATATVQAPEPGNPLQSQVIAIWSDILKVPADSIGLGSNFFELGGHSLNVTELSSRLANRFDVTIQLRDVFTAPTVEALADVVARYLLKEKQIIQPAERKEHYPLTPSQLRTYALHETINNRLAYNIVGGAFIRGPLDADRAEKGFRQLLQLHESLRTSFRIVEGELVQCIEEATAFCLERYEAPAGEADDVIRAFIRPFDLAQAPLMRAAVIRTAPLEHYLLVDLHHIVADGYSLRNILEDFANLYAGNNVAKPLLRYADYAEWQQRPSYQQLLDAQKKYWTAALPAVTRLNLPLDFERPAEPDYNGDKVSFVIGDDLLARLKALAAGEQTTLFTVLLSVFNVFLAKICRQDEIILGTPVIGRNSPQLERLVGMFVNTLILKNRVPGQATFAAFIGEVKASAAGAFAHDEVPFESIAQSVDKAHPAGRNPVFDVFLEYDNLNLRTLKLPGLDVEVRDDLVKRAKFDLTLEIIELEADLKCGFAYRTSLFRRETIEWLRDKFLLLAHLLVENPHGVIGEVDIIGEVYAEPEEETLDFNF